ncbi:DDT domain-containing protein [Nannizzia gypsea CBS 118893]|uniref:DDT domain-containing protein n=1 Tax=Arthroderma gypseum (strain ATCC MYA-4604 / CBS 118893) TaxID=535722 RepID=E4V435_ARTGP|nr:DDT domain-containing protein [Nannizzia gypsea CBS 118893]EFR04759.1 DDT domain-containing protein [Nannizzia gypsea CBS 118893]
MIGYRPLFAFLSLLRSLEGVYLKLKMVLFKRKPVQYLPKPTIDDDNSEVWVIPETNEVFTNYDHFLQRMNFYKQRRFICEITGHSSLTFFEALTSETEGSREVNSAFPESLKEPVLRRVQFSTISRIDSLVREKAKFPEVMHEGRVERRASSRYLVKLTNRNNEEALVDDEHLVRDRKVFTKQMLRSFIKNTVTRESWSGAPWLVKPQIAEHFHIDTEVPKHLQYGNKAGKKANVSAEKEEDEAMFGFFASQSRPINARNKGQKAKSAHELAKAKEEQYLAYRRALNGNPSFRVDKKGFNKDVIPPPDPHENSFNEISIVLKQKSPTPLPPPIKYPIEDLDLPPLDSFTFDDFVEAIQFSSDDMDCELLVEIHCAVLKTLVNAESDQDGAVQISLPPLPEEESEAEEEESDPEPEPEPEPPRRTTRSSFAKAQAELAEMEQQKAPEPDPVEVKKHCAADMFVEYDWIDRLRKRDFKNGGWEIILVGLLNRLSLKPRLKEACEEILIHMAPLDAAPTQETARVQYSTLDVNLRIQILQIICMLTVETRAVKNYMEECSNQMTEFRKEKIELQRARKVVTLLITLTVSSLEEIRLLHEERKQLEPEQRDTPTQQDEEMLDAQIDATDDTESAATDSDAPTGPSLRGGVDRTIERKRKQEAEKERKEQATKEPKGSKKYQRVLKKMEDEKSKVASIESEIAVLDNDLREADCPRTRVLGKDRFWNRYYWFERNGMPYEGLPDSSTASANYANGRLWVQGPDEMEREGFIDVPEQVSQEYKQRFGTTVAKRKQAEEGSSGVSSAQEWGYYDTPEDLDKLMEWLDTRGVRELKLHKELKLQRNHIAKYMENRKTYLTENNTPAEEPNEQPAMRMSTRTKGQATADHKRGCLKWRNLTALKECGHLHVESARPTKRAKKAAATESAKETRMTNRQGRPLGRQGTR